MIEINEFAQEVHALCVEKGFYENKPTDAQIIAGIHSEISEAFEQWRANMPMIWHRCEASKQPCKEGECSAWSESDSQCMDIDDLLNPKLEGIAVELIDVVLRTLNAAAAWGVQISEKDYYFAPDTIQAMELTDLAVYLHYEASLMHCETWFGGKHTGGHPSRIVTAILTWLRAHYIDPMQLMQDKHEYNKGRPYQHGGKRF